MRSRILAAAALATAAVSTGAGSAHAACVGTQQTAVVCAWVHPGALPSVDPTGGTYNDCIYLGTGPCKPVSVPYPTVTPGSGPLVTYGCGGILACN